MFTAEPITDEHLPDANKERNLVNFVLQITQHLNREQVKISVKREHDYSARNFRCRI